jgi:TetR/AcrR family transcriptional regulator
MNSEKNKRSGTRQRLLNVATDLFAAGGYDGVSIREIVGRAKANLGAVTYHFGGKEGLFEAVLETKTAALRQIGQSITESPLGPEAKLRAMLHGYATHLMRTDPSLRVIFASMLSGNVAMPVVAMENIRLRNRMFCDVVNEGIRDGRFRKVDVECLAINFFGMLSAYVLHRSVISPDGGAHEASGGVYTEAYVDRVVDAALDVFMNGLRKR